MKADDWKEIEVTLRYRDGALTPGGTERGQPSDVEELVEEIDRAMNASHFGGTIELRMKGGYVDCTASDCDGGQVECGCDRRCCSGFIACSFCDGNVMVCSTCKFHDCRCDET